MIGFLKAIFGGAAKETPATTIVELASSGTYNINLVGESRYQDTLEDICGGRDSSSANLLCQAILCPDRNNPHDPLAVAALIDGEPVGYLDRDEARRWHADLFDKGVRAALCDAIVVGGWKRSKSDIGAFGVKIDVAMPFRVIQSRG